MNRNQLIPAAETRSPRSPDFAICPSVSLSGERSDRGCPVSLFERFHREFARPAGLSVWSEGSPRGRGSGVRFFGTSGRDPAASLPKLCGLKSTNGISPVGAGVQCRLCTADPLHRRKALLCEFPVPPPLKQMDCDFMGDSRRALNSRPN